MDDYQVEAIAIELSKIKEGLMLANAISLLHLGFDHKHTFEDRDIDKHLEAAMKVVTNY